MRNKRFLPVLVFFILMFFAMRIQGAALITSFSPRGIIDLEFARIPSLFNQMLQRMGRTNILINVFLDFIFIISYWLFFTVAFNKLSVGRTTAIFQMQGGHYALISVAAVLDIVENISMLICLSAGATPFWVYLTYVVAMIKFFAVALAILHLLILLLLFFAKRRLTAKQAG
jgi:hypothetical protein